MEDQVFARLDRLIAAGYGGTPQFKIPAAVVTAAERGLPITIKGTDQADIRYAKKFDPAAPLSQKALARMQTELQSKKLKYQQKKKGQGS